MPKAKKSKIGRPRKKPTTQIRSTDEDTLFFDTKVFPGIDMQRADRFHLLITFYKEHEDLVPEFIKKHMEASKQKKL